MNIKIAPSLLAADLTCLKDEIVRAEKGGCDAFHVDIMDGHFVPNLSFGPGFVETIRQMTTLPLDVHLMVDNPLEFIGPFADAGSDFLTIHVESQGNITETLACIQEHGVQPGITFRPDTPLETVFTYLSSIPLVLVMSVYPGFGGQQFIESSYVRMHHLAEKASQVNPSLIISVDGGINFNNAPLLVKAGANYLVSGTTIFKNHKAEENIRQLRNVITF